MSAREWTEDRQRLDLAKRALVRTGYFTEAEVGDDVAPRITELVAAIHAEARRAGAIEELEKAANLVARDRFASRAAVRVLRRRAAALRGDVP